MRNELVVKLAIIDDLIFTELKLFLWSFFSFFTVPLCFLYFNFLLSGTNQARQLFGESKR